MVWSTISDIFTAVPTEAPDGARTAVPQADAAGPDPAYSARLSAEMSRHPARLVAACLATVLGPAVVAQAGSARLPDADLKPGGEVIVAEAAARPAAPAPGDPAAWRIAAQAAARTCPGLPGAVLVAIGQVESRLGLQPSTSPAGAEGPMQFLPGTWAAYGADGDGDGRADVMNTSDALLGAARLLCANGGAEAGRLPSAVWNYNHSDAYVERIMALAAS